MRRYLVIGSSKVAQSALQALAEMPGQNRLALVVPGGRANRSVVRVCRRLGADYYLGKRWRQIRHHGAYHLTVQADDLPIESLRDTVGLGQVIGPGELAELAPGCPFAARAAFLAAQRGRDPWEDERVVLYGCEACHGAVSETAYGVPTCETCGEEYGCG